MSVVESVAWVLLHFLWQGAAIALSLGLALALTPATWSAIRYALGCGALALMLAAPLATAASRPVQGLGRLAAPAAETGEERRSQTLSARRQATAPTGASTANVIGPMDATAARSWMPDVRVIDALLPWLVVSWAAGVLLLSVRLLAGWWRTRALRVSGVSAVPDACAGLLARTARRMGIRRPVAIKLSTRVTVPVVLGHLTPIVLVPAAVLAGLSPSQLEAILAHELAHVRRHDYLVNLVQTLIETLLFYHPAVWWVSRQVRVAREHCCDDIAVAVCGNRRQYVQALLGLEQLRQPAVMLALGAADGPLLARARRLLVDPDREAPPPRLAASAIAMSVVALAIAGVSTASERQAPAADPSAAAASQGAPTPGTPTPGNPSLGNASPGKPSPGNTDQPREQGAPASAVPAPSASVTTAPNAAETLNRRWAWAEQQAHAGTRGRYWVGYSLTPAPALPPIVYLDRRGTILGNRMTFRGGVISSHGDGLSFPGQRLAIAPPPGRAVKLLFAFDSKGGRPALSAVHGSAMDLPAELDGLPVFWLGAAPAAESLARIDTLYAAASTELRDDLLGAAAVADDSARVVAWLEKRLAGNEPEKIRADAAEWMAWHPIPASLAALDRLARTDRASRVRQEAAEAIGDLAMPEATPKLVALAQSLADVDARREAVEALGARPELEARDALGRIARQDTNLDVQREAVETLGDYEDRRGVPLLLDLVRSHPSPEVRREVVETLGDALPRDAVAPLLRQLALEDADEAVQREAIETLAGVEDNGGLATLMELAQSHPRTHVRREAVEALGQSISREEGGGAGKDAAAVVELLSRLADGDREPEVQREAVETLGEVPVAQAVERLRAIARTHASAEVRREAIETLAEHAAPTAVVALLRDTIQRDTDAAVRSDAVERLANVDDPDARVLLRDLARLDPDERIRSEAIETLGDTQPAQEVADLLKRIAADEKSTRVQHEAIETLSELPGGAGVAALIDLARDHPSAELRRLALEKLIDSQDPRARALFARALQKPGR